MTAPDSEIALIAIKDGKQGQVGGTTTPSNSNKRRLGGAGLSRSASSLHLAASSAPVHAARFKATSSLLSDVHRLQRRTIAALDALLGTDPLPADIAQHSNLKQVADRLSRAVSASKSSRLDPRRSPPPSLRRTGSSLSSGSQDEPIETREQHEEDPYYGAPQQLPTVSQQPQPYSAQPIQPPIAAHIKMDAEARRFIESTRPAGISTASKPDPDFRTRHARTQVANNSTPYKASNPAWLESVSPLMTSEVERLERNYKELRPPANGGARTDPPRRQQRSSTYEPAFSMAPPKQSIFGLEESDLTRITGGAGRTNTQFSGDDQLTQEPVARRLFTRAAASMPSKRLDPQPSGLDVTGLYDHIPTANASFASTRAPGTLTRQSTAATDRSVLGVGPRSVGSVSAPTTRPASPVPPSAPTEAEVFGLEQPSTAARTVDVGTPSRSGTGTYNKPANKGKTKEHQEDVEISERLQKMEELERRFGREKDNARLAGTANSSIAGLETPPRRYSTERSSNATNNQRTWSSEPRPTASSSSSVPSSSSRNIPISLPSQASKTEIDEAIARLEALESIVRQHVPAQSREVRSGYSTPLRKVPEINVTEADDSGYAGGYTPRSSLGFNSSVGRNVLLETPGSQRSEVPSLRRTADGGRSLASASVWRTPGVATSSTSAAAKSSDIFSPPRTQISKDKQKAKEDPLSVIGDTARSLRTLVASSAQLASSAAKDASVEDGSAEVLLALAKVAQAVHVGLGAIGSAVKEIEGAATSRVGAVVGNEKDGKVERTVERQKREDLFRFRHHHDGEVCYGGRTCVWYNS